MTTAPLLKIEDLRTYFYSRTKQAFIRSVDNVSLEIAKGETLGVVGESGSGKSITALSILGLISDGPGVISGRIGFKTDRVERNLLQDLGDYVALTKKDSKIMSVKKDVKGWDSRRCDDGARRDRHDLRTQIIAQPFYHPSQQIAEPSHHTAVTSSRSKDRAIAGWTDGVDSPRLRMNYSFGLSGGMCQRTMIHGARKRTVA
jgi:ABC-type dipeptide/oligopeptide/nickel transport system ATPase component